ncbi:MAG: AmmeMemoRadiSam system protein B [Lentisphaeria bacterium]|jgi:hypothetical protein|nr:AmmeMemoRadiSam system protein B [Lentisphaeria bacterium]
MPKIRPPAVAGQFYPDSVLRLQDFLNEFLVSPSRCDSAPVSGLIVPHAGLRYSGETAAIAFSVVDPARWRQIVLIGPSHYRWFHGIAVAPHDFFRTPLGDVPVDTAVCKALVAAETLFEMNEDAHAPEHALEVELPFIQHLMPECPVIPLVCGDLTPEETRQAAAALDAVLPPETLFVVSSDFTHYGERFGYVPFTEAEAPGQLPKLDHGAIDEIIRQDADGFMRYCERTGATICGQRPVAVMLALHERRQAGGDFELLHYTNTGEMLGDYSSTVSYAAIVHRAAEAADDLVMSEEAVDVLLNVAHDAIASELANEEYRPPSTAPPHLYDHGACFVTLRLRGDLRGCMGSLEAKEPLLENVGRNAVNAAFHDPRFPSLTDTEFRDVDLQISCLTPQRPIASIDDFELGRHGIILEKDGKRAVFLPQVATEQRWDRETTMLHLERKAGLREGSWRQGAQLYVFETVCCGGREPRAESD